MYRTKKTVLGKRKSYSGRPAGKTRSMRRRTAGTDSNTNTLGGAPLRHGYIIQRSPYVYKELYHAENDIQGRMDALQNTTAGVNLNFAGWTRAFNGPTVRPGFLFPDGINTGTTATERLGASIFLRDAVVRYKITGPTDWSAGHTQDTVRVVAIMDKNGNTGQLLSALVTTGNNTFTTASMKPQFADEYQILYDKTHTVEATNDGAAKMFPPNHSSLGIIRLKINKVVNFQQSVPDTRFYVIFVSEKNWAAVQAPATTTSVNANLQLTFTQM